MFVGGLSWLSTTESMRAYFEKFGPVEECVIMRDAKTKITRQAQLVYLTSILFSGFGFVTFVNPGHINNVLMIKDHFLDGKKVSLNLH
jgi:RNA recognition motif-containing protein